MKKIVLFIATSLDGYIVRPDGSLDWLTSIPQPQSGDDYGYTAFLSSVGTTIMGRKTYDEIIGFGVEWPYTGIDSYVVTKNRDLKIQTSDTYTLTDNLKEFVTNLKAKADKDIWLIGGGELIKIFINEGLLDKMIITVIPKIIGEGVPLFVNKTNETNWKLIEAKSFDTGVVNLTYEKMAN